MITLPTTNTPVCAPELEDLDAILVKFRTFSGNEVLQQSDLIDFITSPSARRTQFLAQLNVTTSLVDNKFVTQKYL